MKLNRIHWIVAGSLAGVLAALCYVGWLYGVHPLAADYDDAIAKKQDLEQKLQTARDTAAQFEKFKAQAENTRRDLEFFSSRVDTPLSQNEVFQQVYGLGNELNLRDWSVDAKAPSQGGSASDLGVCKVEVKFKGDFEHVGRVLNAMLLQRRLMVPDTILLKGLDDPNGSYFDTLDVDLNLSVYGAKAGKGGRS